MRKKPIHYIGSDINNCVISRVKEIAKSRYEDFIYDASYSWLNNVDDLFYRDDAIKDEEEHIILGEDWYIGYVEGKNEIYISDWVALEKSENKLTQTAEMVIAMKNILLLCKNREICAFMRHNTSYKFYLRFLERDYIQELEDYPRWLEYIPDDLLPIVAKYSTAGDYLGDENKKVYPNIEKYILHEVVFKPTKKILKRYNN